MIYDYSIIFGIAIMPKTKCVDFVTVLAVAFKYTEEQKKAYLPPPYDNCYPTRRPVDLLPVCCSGHNWMDSNGDRACLGT